MRIGICYDTKEDYGYESDNLNYTDFVSLQTVASIREALENIGHDVTYINAKNLINFIEKENEQIDFIFNLVEGIRSRNRVALVPAYLEFRGIKHSGSDTFATAIAQNKHFTKLLLRNLGINTPEGFVYECLTDSVIREAVSLGFPLVIKPNSEGGGMGVVMVNNIDEFIYHSRYLIKKFNFELLCEKYIKGKELTVPIIGNGKESQALGVVAIVNKDYSDIDLYDAKKKYENNVIGILDFPCPDHIKEEIKNISLNIHKYIGINDYSRMDYRMDENGNLYFLEANLLPFLNREGSFEVCFKKIGKCYQDVIERIINSSLRRYSRSYSGFTL